MMAGRGLRVCRRWDVQVICDVDITGDVETVRIVGDCQTLRDTERVREIHIRLQARR